MRSISILLAVCLTTGCAATLPAPTPVPWEPGAQMVPQPVHVFLDATLSDSIQQQARQAVEEWNVALGGHLHLQVVSGIPLQAYTEEYSRQHNDILILGVEFAHPMIQRAHVPGGNVSRVIAVTYPYGMAPGALIYLATDKVRYPHDTILHELAHALGAEDRDSNCLGGKVCLMSRTYSGISYIDADAATQVAHHFH